eukprot:g10643.t1
MLPFELDELSKASALQTFNHWKRKSSVNRNLYSYAKVLLINSSDMLVVGQGGEVSELLDSNKIRYSQCDLSLSYQLAIGNLRIDI